MTADDHTRYQALLDQADQCRDLADQALKDGSPVGFREWMEAHNAARLAADSIKYPAQRVTVDA